MKCPNTYCVIRVVCCDVHGNRHKINASQHPVFVRENEGSSRAGGCSLFWGDKPTLISALRLTAGEPKDRSENGEATISDSLLNRTAHLIPANPRGHETHSGIWNRLMKRAHSTATRQPRGQLKRRLKMSSTSCPCLVFN